LFRISFSSSFPYVFLFFFSYSFIPSPLSHPTLLPFLFLHPLSFFIFFNILTRKIVRSLSERAVDEHRNHRLTYSERVLALEVSTHMQPSTANAQMDWRLFIM
jgi:hypothetical protein